MPSGGRLTAIAVATALVALAHAPVLAGAQGKGGGKKHRCAGKIANMVGTDKADVIRLKGGGDVVASLDGNDTILGAGGRDIVCSGNGADRVLGGEGADFISTAGGDDSVNAGGGTDTVSGGRGRDSLNGGGGPDLLNGGREADSLSGGAGNDTVLAGGAKDKASGGEGDDVLVGGRGDDRLSGGAGNDTMRGQIGADRMRGGSGVDVMQGEADIDRIGAGPGDDQFVDGGSGTDRVDGGPGADTLHGGFGGDWITGGTGPDLIIGGGGGESLLGEGGDDRLYGGLVDDTLHGGLGDDLLVGGHGVDTMFGNSGSDWLRGDSNRDWHYGGVGDDVVSYATSTPPGAEPGLGGVSVNLAAEKAIDDPPQQITDQEYPEEPLKEVESVVGSTYDDVLLGRGVGFADGLGGSDVCLYFSTGACSMGNDEPSSYVELTASSPDPGLLISGHAGTDSLALSATASTYVVTGNVTLTAGDGCTNSAPAVVSCAKPSKPLGFATVFGGDGPDVLTISPGYPDTATILLNGGTGDDVLNGSVNDEILIGGPSGRDRMNGGSGDDALFSGPGADSLEGADGHDNLVTSDACSGHLYSGGPGFGDIAGFAQNIDYGIEAKVGGQAIGRGVPNCTPTRMEDDLEVLEGTQHDDVLVGDHRSNPLILGKQGDDVLIGMGGNDTLRGERGRDALYGGPGADQLQAFDGIKDIALHCGPGGSDALRDRFDPPGMGCVDRDPRLTPKQKRAKRDAERKRRRR